MLKKIRIVVASFFLIAVTLLFLDFTGTVHDYLGWVAKAQFVPAALAVNAAVIAGLLLMTAMFGRVYCSMICPLGIVQDKISRMARLGKRNRFAYRRPRKALVIARYALLGIFILALFANIPFVTALLEPYSAYGRMIAHLAGPLYKYGNNILAHFAERADSYAFYSVDVWITSVGALAVAILTLITITVFAAKSGRGYCNAVCPAGALLGIVSKFSLIKIRIKKDKCAKCGLCARNCKAGCIDPSRLEIDYTRCVACFNCIGVCPKCTVVYSAGSKMLSNNCGSTDNKESSADNRGSSSMKESSVKEAPFDGLTTEGMSRRNIIAGIATLAFGAATGAVARTYEFDGGLAPIEEKKPPARNTAIIPPGARNARNFRRRCTGCQLCVAACPNNVLRPSNKFSEFMQPHLSFERGYCRPECVKCSEVCPTGAIQTITTAEKSSTQIGQAVWSRDLCIVNVDRVQCDLCERKCPTSAIRLIPQKADDPASLKIPMIDTARCIGCGACENLCPSRPYSAIYVEGVESHRTI